MRTRIALATLLATASLLATPATGAPGGTPWAVTHPGNEWVGWDGMSAFPDGTGFALFDSPDGGTSAEGVLRTRDFGATWTEVLAPPGLVLEGLAMGSPARGFAAASAPQGEYEPQRDVYNGGILVTTDAATTWRKVPIVRRPGAAGLLATTMSAAPGGRSAVLVAKVMRSGGGFLPGGEVVWIADGGRTMRRATLGGEDSVPMDVAVRDDSTAYVSVVRWRDTTERWLPGTPCCEEYDSDLYVTHDAGRSWRVVATFAHDEIMSLDTVADRVIAVSLRHGTVFVSRDGGRRFGKVGAVRLLPPAYSDDGTHPPCSEVDFVNERVGFATTCLAGQYRTEDGGETWQLEPSPNHGDFYTSPFVHFDAVAGFDETHAISAYVHGVMTRQAP